MKEELSKATRTESDLIGEREVPETALYGVQTLRGIENFRISKYHLCEYPFIYQGTWPLPRWEPLWLTLNLDC